MAKAARWFSAHPRVLRAAQALLVLVVLVHLGATIRRTHKHGGDLVANREFGARFLERSDLYRDGCCFNYMPVSAMYWAPLALVSPEVAVVGRYLTALAALGVVLVLLGRLTAAVLPPGAPRAAGFTAGATLVLGSHYLLRDLDDGGPHVVYLALMLLGITCAARGRERQAGLWFSLPVVLKLTPALVIPFFLWKRRFRLAAWTTACATAWIVAPACWLGPSAWWQAQSQFHAVVASVVAGRHHPQRDANELHVQNQNLRLGVERWLVDYPPGHPLRLAHRAYIGGLGLSPAHARRLALAAAAGLVALCGWRSRARYRSPDDPRWPAEMAGLLLLTVLLSPVTWLQHLVFVLPALYLLVAQAVGSASQARSSLWPLVVYAVAVLLLNRELIGRPNYLLLLSFQMHTAATLLLLVLVLWKIPPRVEPADQAAARPTLLERPARRAA